MPDTDDLDLAPGTLLVAPPTLGDPNFRRSVVLLCEHSPAEGSFGLSLGRPLEQDLALSDVLDLGDPVARLRGEDFPLALGGPVQPETLHYLHRHPEAVPGATEVTEGVRWGGDFDDVKVLLADGEADAQSLRFFLGYAGWGAGQLRAELDQGGWILAPADVELVFPESLDAFWRQIMRRLGGEYALLSNFPDNPRMN
jgi:putative transcriptional regulator